MKALKVSRLLRLLAIVLAPLFAVILLLSGLSMQVTKCPARPYSDMQSLATTLFTYRMLAKELPSEATWEADLCSKENRAKIALMSKPLLDPWGSHYVFKNLSEPGLTKFRIVSPGPDKILGTPDDEWHEFSRPVLK